MTQRRSRIGRLLAALFIRGAEAPFILRDLDDSFNHDVARGLAPAEVRRRDLRNILASAGSVWAESLRPSAWRPSLVDVRLGLRTIRPDSLAQLRRRLRARYRDPGRLGADACGRRARTTVARRSRRSHPHALLLARHRPRTCHRGRLLSLADIPPLVRRARGLPADYRQPRHGRHRSLGTGHRNHRLDVRYPAHARDAGPRPARRRREVRGAQRRRHRTRPVARAVRGRPEYRWPSSPDRRRAILGRRRDAAGISVPDVAPTLDASAHARRWRRSAFRRDPRRIRQAFRRRDARLRPGRTSGADEFAGSRGPRARSIGFAPQSFLPGT